MIRPDLTLAVYHAWPHPSVSAWALSLHVTRQTLNARLGAAHFATARVVLDVFSAAEIAIRCAIGYRIRQIAEIMGRLDDRSLRRRMKLIGARPEQFRDEADFRALIPLIVEGKPNGLTPRPPKADVVHGIPTSAPAFHPCHSLTSSVRTLPFPLLLVPPQISTLLPPVWSSSAEPRLGEWIAMVFFASARRSTHDARHPHRSEASPPRLRRSPHVQQAFHSNALVVFDGRHYYTLASPVAIDLWISLEKAQSIQDLITYVHERYEAPSDLIERDTARLLAYLQAQSLVLPVDSRGTVIAPHRWWWPW